MAKVRLALRSSMVLIRLMGLRNLWKTRKSRAGISEIKAAGAVTSEAPNLALSFRPEKIQCSNMAGSASAPLSLVKALRATEMLAQRYLPSR